MKNLNRILALVLFIFAEFYFIGCSNFLTPSNNPDASSISIKITSPVSNDTINYRGNFVTYTYTPLSGLYAVELHTIIGSTDKFAWYPANGDGSNPLVPISVDSSLVGSKISLYIIYFDKSNFSTRSDTVKNILVTEITSPPAIPYQVTISQLSATSINISWRDSSLVPPGFEIFRRTGFTGTFAQVATASPGSNNITDSGLLPNQVYCYKVRAINKYGISDFSQIVDNSGAHYSGNILPPTNLYASTITKNYVILNWVDNSDNENFFRVERRYSFSNYETIANLDKNSVTYIDSTVISGTQYTYRIKAFSSSDSAWSNELTITTPLAKQK